MATVRVRVGSDGKKRWQVRYLGSDGREHAQTFHRKTDADRFVVTTETDKLRGNWVNPRLGKIRLRDWAEQVSSTRVLKPKTQAGYESLLRQHILPRLGDRRLAAIKPSDVQTFVVDLRRELSPSRVRHAYFVLRSTLDAAVRDGVIGRNPCVGIELPKAERREERHMDAARLAAVAEACGPYRTLVMLLGTTGMRWGETAALRVRDVDLLGGRIHVRESISEVGGALHVGPPKSGKPRSIRAPGAVLDSIRIEIEGKSSQNLVFTAPGGGPLRHANFRNRVWLPALREARLPADTRIHDLRHTAVALLIEQGAPAKMIQDQLGHASITTTMDVYGHLIEDHLDEITKAMDAALRAEKRTRTKSGQARRLKVVGGQQQLL